MLTNNGYYSADVAYLKSMEEDRLKSLQLFQKRLNELVQVQGPERDTNAIALYKEEVYKITESILTIRSAQYTISGNNIAMHKSRKELHKEILSEVVSAIEKENSGFDILTNLVKNEPDSGWEFYTTDHHN